MKYMPFMFFDPTYIIVIPGIILALFAQARVQNAYSRYSRVLAQSGLTGAELARQLLQRNRVYDVKVEMTRGRLTDHYDPRTKTLRLSPEVYQSSSLAALGIAAHEAGHAFQHAMGYIPLTIRNAIVPFASFGSRAWVIFFLLGILFSLPNLVMVGIYVFVAVVLFQLITLPVEFNASNRAMAALESGGYLTRNEAGSTRKVLNAAALTYVAATLMAILQLLRLLAISGAFGRRRD